MPEAQLLLRFENRAALRQEYAQNLSHGRAFVPGASGLQLFSACTLVLACADLDTQLALECEVVMLCDAPHPRGIAVQFVDRSQASLARVRAFALGDEQAPSAPPDAHRLSGAPGAHHPSDALDEQEPSDALDEHDATAGQRAIVEARAAKLRNLTPAQRMQVARGSVQEERVLLERIYGSAVWELLLRNPKITLPEVARMARKGTMPRPLLDLIAENEQWVRHSLVRRALLGNPRLGTDSILRVLRMLPPRELKLVPQQTAYPPSVRQAATRLMRGG